MALLLANGLLDPWQRNSWRSISRDRGSSGPSSRTHMITDAPEATRHGMDILSSERCERHLHAMMSTGDVFDTPQMCDGLGIWFRKPSTKSHD